MNTITLRSGKPSERYGKSPQKRSIPELLDFGIVIIDKPAGPTSHQVSAYVRDIVHVKKTGHSGTLDPQVTGVLPVAIGRGTRVVQALLTAGKEYVCVMHLHDDIPREKLEKILEEFKGKIKQLPPVKSAVKRQWRERSVYSLDILDVLDRDVCFRTSCQAGTYIRKLCHDMGASLGCGAHMAELRRTRAGPFDESFICTLQDLSDAYHAWKEDKDEAPLRKLILPAEAAVNNLKKIWVLDSTVDSLCHGATLKLPGIARISSGISFDEPIAVMTLKDELIGLGTAKMSSEDMQKYTSGISAKLSSVVMPIGVYPKMEKDA